MPIVDAHGRLFGRINLVDAAIGGFVFMLIPVAYATYLLFRPPSPTITSVEPAPVTLIEERAAQGTRLGGKLKVRGTGLRPVLRAKVGPADGIAFIFETPQSADVLYGVLPPGRHDLVLYDGVQEVARAEGVVLIPEESSAGHAWLAVAGTFLMMSPGQSERLQVNAEFPSDGNPRARVVRLAPAEPAMLMINNRAPAAVAQRVQRPALLAVRCDIDDEQPRECAVGRVAVTPGETLELLGSADRFRFQIDEVLPSLPPTASRLQVRLFGSPEMLRLINVNDADQPHLAVDERGAVIRAIGARRDGPGEISVLLSQERSPTLASATRGETVASVDVTLSVGLDAARTGWTYRGEPVRVGGPFTFLTRTYMLRGIVLGLEPDAAASDQHRPNQ
jgi:hypothetical protein